MFTHLFSIFTTMRGVETWACSQLDYWFGYLMKHLFNPKEVIATISILGQLFSFMTTRAPIKAYGEALDLTGYELVFEDEFDGDSLNTDVWNYRAMGASHGGFYSADVVSVHDGNLFIEPQYLENGSYGAGWYAAQLALNEKYTYGYFECRCVCSHLRGFWSAFWLQNPHSYDADISKGGPGGAEIDIMEANADNSTIAPGKDAVLSCIHVNGGKNDKTEGSDTSGAVYFYGNNIYEEYNTYGVLWNEDEYIFYINGVESIRSAWSDGASRVPEEVILSVCIPAGNLDNINQKGEVGTMKVDYVRIYQLAE